MLEPITQRQKTLIVNNVLRAVKDINQLNKTGYNFLYLCSGFIAHYNLGGFKSHYSDYSLRDDILQYAGYNKWSNFRPGDENYEYYRSKADVYQAIVQSL